MWLGLALGYRQPWLLTHGIRSPHAVSAHPNPEVWVQQRSFRELGPIRAAQHEPGHRLVSVGQIVSWLGQIESYTLY
jgi:hypothetical protein